MDPNGNPWLNHAGGNIYSSGPYAGPDHRHGLAFHTEWEDGAAMAYDIGSGSDGTRWIVDTRRQVYRNVGGGWEDMGLGGAEGSVWGIFTDGRIVRYDTRVDGNWKYTSQHGKRLDVATNGRPYIVREDGTIFHYVGDRDVNNPEWVDIDRSLRAKDIGVNGPSIWAVAQNGRVHRWGDEVNDWEQTNGFAHEISVDQNGGAWAVQGGTRNVVRGIAQ